jgi:hypothetical protein
VEVEATFNQGDLGFLQLLHRVGSGGSSHKDYIRWARNREGRAGKDIYKDLLDLYAAVKKQERKRTA